LASENGPLPATRIVRTGSGGLHYFFRHPGHFTVRNSTSWLAPGIDIRGKGGQVVAPPSVSGRGPYEVIADHPVAEAPDWLLELLHEHTRNYDNGRSTEAKGAEHVDMALVPERVRIAATTLIGEDEGRHKHFHSIVAACYEAGYTQGQTVTIAAPWCAAVDKFVGRVESEVARSWGKIQAAADKQNEWLPDSAGPNPTPLHPTNGNTALKPVPNPTPAADDQDDTDPDDDPALDLTPTWRPVDLEPILTGTYQPETPQLYPRSDGVALVYPGRVHSFHGESESGKSLVVQAEAARLIGERRDVLYIDFESDAGAVVGRLLDMGATPDLIRAHFTYLRPDNDPRRFPHEREEFAAVAAGRYALAVIDGMTDALGVFGAGTKDNDEIASFMRSFPRLLAVRTGAAVIIIDHVTKDADSRGRFALGGQAKMNALDGSAYVVEVVEALGRGLRGAVSLRVAKDRPGGVRPHCGPFRKLDRTQEAARVVIDSTGGSIEVHVEAPHRTVDSDPEAAKTWRPTVLMQKVSDFLEHAVAGVSQTTIEEGLGGTRDHVRKALALLVAEGFVEVESGPRNARLHSLSRPYFADEDPESDTYVGWAEPGQNDTTPPPRRDRAGTAPTAGSGDRAGKPVSPTGDRRGQELGSEGSKTTTAPDAEKPYLEVACAGCFRPVPKAIADTWSGRCSNCAREAGLL
ncbi:MAG TPA: bifunctional DNA primase/polymerase, partial [Acidimicrobiales bacterium]|nr:bifunctional DNA primase/polymerase [Acidimicrobiales bacterium]